MRPEPADIISQLHDIGLIDRYIEKIALKYYPDCIDDIKGEVWLAICEKGEKLVECFQRGGLKEVRGYCVGLAHRQIISTTSTIFKQYRHKGREVYTIEDRELLKDILRPQYLQDAGLLDDILAELEPFDRFALNTWLEYGNVGTMANQLGYSKASINILLTDLTRKIIDLL